MPIKLSFADYLAVVGIVATLILVVLDKAGRLKGPVLLVLLAVAALLTLPLLLGIDWVADAEGSARFARTLLMICIVGVGYAALAAWVSPSSKRIAQDGDLRFAIGRNDKDTTLRVTVNQQHFWISLGFLDSGSFQDNWRPKDYPVRVYTDPNDTKPYIDTKVYSSELGLAEIKKNHLTVKPKGWDENANGRAIEIVNEYGIPVFQAVLSAANQLDINGVFSEGESKSGWRYVPLFKYPSAEHPGEFDGQVDLLPLKAKSLYQLYLEGCGATGGSHGGWRIDMPDGSKVVVDESVCADLDSRAAWLNIFIPKYGDPATILTAFASQYRARLEPELRMGTAFLRVNPGEPVERGSKLIFTGVIGVYHEGLLLPEQPDAIRAEFEKQGAHVRFYGPDYVFTKNSSLSPTAGRY